MGAQGAHGQGLTSTQNALFGSSDHNWQMTWFGKPLNDFLCNETEWNSEPFFTSNF